jgi:hypothetical protein
MSSGGLIVIFGEQERSREVSRYYKRLWLMNLICSSLLYSHQLHTLDAAWLPIATIARQLGISRPTVYAYLRRTTPPSPKRAQFQWTARPSAKATQSRGIVLHVVRSARPAPAGPVGAGSSRPSGLA